MKNLIKKIRYKIFNKIHKTKIKSVRANLSATYGKEVLIDENVFVDSDVTIGNYSYVNKNSSVENCSIGNYCSISSGVYINPYEHAINYRSTHPFCDKNREKRKPVIIGNDVLISLNCVILEGVEIGNGAVIGAGAVVTKNVEPYEIVGGVPAKHIGWRFDEEERERIAQSKWWDYDKNILEKDLSYFNRSSNKFMEEK